MKSVPKRGDDHSRPWWLPPAGRIHPLWWIPVGALVLWIEYVTGLYVQFPVVYIIPVSLAAWYSGRWPAVALAIAIPIVHFAFLVTHWGQPGTVVVPVAMGTFRGAVIIFMALWFARLSDYERELTGRVKALEGLLPICAFCKSIRNDAGEWERLERFISKRSEVLFSHAFCPSCAREHYPVNAQEESALH